MIIIIFFGRILRRFSVVAACIVAAPILIIMTDGWISFLKEFWFSIVLFMVAAVLWAMRINTFDDLLRWIDSAATINKEENK